MNIPDPPVDEVREVRREISERFHHDPVRLVEYYISSWSSTATGSFRHPPLGRASPRSEHAKYRGEGRAEQQVREGRKYTKTRTSL